MGLLLGIDFGTSYFKVGLFEADGRCAGLGRVAVGTDAPQPGRSELSPDHFWLLLRQALAEALAATGGKTRDIAAVSYASQANTFILLDRSDRPLTPLIIWSDRRAVPLESELQTLGEEESFLRETGVGRWTGEFAPAKWRWLQAHEPACWAAARRVLFLPDYFTHALTGEATGDASTAALTGVFATATGVWSDRLLAAVGVTRAQLAAPLRPGTVAGRTTARAAELLGLAAGVPLVVGGLDHYLAALGSGLADSADASLSTGTVLAALRLVSAVQPRADCYHGVHFDGRFYRLAFDPAGAGELEAYRDLHAPGWEISRLVNPARGDDQMHAARVRAILEHMGRSQRELLQRLGVAPPERVIATGGGARSASLLQLQADLLGVPVFAPAVPEAACLGAAAFAAIAAGWHADIREALAAMCKPGTEYQPTLTAS